MPMISDNEEMLTTRVQFPPSGNEGGNSVSNEFNVTTAIDQCTVFTMLPAKGEKGDKGDPGESAYTIAQGHGFPGTEAQWEELMTETYENAQTAADAAAEASRVSAYVQGIVDEGLGPYYYTKTEADNLFAPKNNTYTKTEIDGMLLALFPIGSVYITITNMNPGNFIGGTWASFGNGRVLMGEGTGEDTNGLSQTFTGGTEGGEYTHTLSVNEIPAHNHSFYRFYSNGEDTGLSSERRENARRTHINTTSTGGGQAHNIVQPYVVVYFWRRIA